MRKLYLRHPIQQTPQELLPALVDRKVDVLTIDGPSSAEKTESALAFAKVTGLPTIMRSTSGFSGAEIAEMLDGGIIPALSVRPDEIDVHLTEALAAFPRVLIELEMTPADLQITPALERLKKRIAETGIRASGTIMPVFSDGGMPHCREYEELERAYFEEYSELLRAESNQARDARLKGERSNLLILPCAIAVWDSLQRDKCMALNDGMLINVEHSPLYGSPRISSKMCGFLRSVLTDAESAEMKKGAI